MSDFERGLVSVVKVAIERSPNLIHVVTGPRQVGKTTVAHAMASRWKGPVRYAAADELVPAGAEWIQSEWQLARLDASDKRPGLLVLDEVQKIPNWSEVVKGLWDADRRVGRPMRVILLGSSALLLGHGVTESLAGRFFLHRCSHWSFAECKQAFGWDLDRWLFFGGYPGAAPLADDVDAWRAYVRDALIEAVLARDVLSLERVTKPTLLRHLFSLACRFPAQALSYNKMLGQLHDAGNTTTLSHYLQLLEKAFLASGIEKYSGSKGRSRGSSPKFVLWNNALVNALDLRDPGAARADRSWWGRVVENAVGAHLLNHLAGPSHEISWWRDRDDEVDFVVRSGRNLWGLEVKTGRDRVAGGMRAFLAKHSAARPLLIGEGGLALEKFFATDPARLLGG